MNQFLPTYSSFSIFKKEQVHPKVVLQEKKIPQIQNTNRNIKLPSKSTSMEMKSSHIYKEAQQNNLQNHYGGIQNMKNTFHPNIKSNDMATYSNELTSFTDFTNVNTRLDQNNSQKITDENLKYSPDIYQQPNIMESNTSATYYKDPTLSDQAKVDLLEHRALQIINAKDSQGTSCNYESYTPDEGSNNIFTNSYHVNTLTNQSNFKNQKNINIDHDSTFSSILPQYQNQQNNKVSSIHSNTISKDKDQSIVHHISNVDIQSNPPKKPNYELQAFDHDNQYTSSSLNIGSKENKNPTIHSTTQLLHEKDTLTNDHFGSLYKKILWIFQQAKMNL